MKLLFVCVGNSCRSQMAEGLARSMGHEAFSAGSHPGDKVASNAVVAMEEIGIDISAQYPKNVDLFLGDKFDMVISMGCGVSCPNISIDADWNLEDPHGMHLEKFQEIRKMIKTHLIELG